MKLNWARSEARYPLAPTLLRVYLLVGIAILAVAFLLYFRSLTQRVDEQTEAMSDIVARFLRITVTTVAQLPEGSAPESDYHSIVSDLEFPVVISDHQNHPILWNESQVGVADLTDEELFPELDPQNPKYLKVLQVQSELDHQNPPIPVLHPVNQDTFAYVHYGSVPLSTELKWTPWVAIGVAGLFGLSALLSLRSIKRSEQGFIWAGMAKETAHQMGTPISSLVGWVELLRAEVGDRAENDVTIPAALYNEVVDEIDRDAERLKRVADRFSQIGSAPKLAEGSIEKIVEQTVDYFSHRLPRQSRKIEIRYSSEGESVPVRFNPELLGWVLENLIKNAIDAADKDQGLVQVRVEGNSRNNSVSLSVRDNGRGVRPGMEKQIFRPGVSTRTRGWGLGLPLAQRIVTEYHRGRLELGWSEPGKGAEFRITLPSSSSGSSSSS